MPRNGDALKEYRDKRDFTRTNEPSGKAKKASSSAGLRFVVQKHDASRLHYDFRLELDGVLKSWAVAKGPSPDPAQKRLAVRVEDHPLDYGSFEGIIPEGQYGGGTVMLWDEGTWEPVGDPHDGLADGDLKFVLHGRRLKGSWVLVHMKGRDQQRSGRLPRENWLLIKHDDDHADRDHPDGLTEQFTDSVTTGRDLDAIARGPKRGKRTAKAAVAPATPVSGEGREQPQPPAPPKSKAVSAKARTSAYGSLSVAAGVAAAQAAGVRVTSPDRIAYPGQGVTKGELLAYYATVAPAMLKHLADHPLSLVRCPQGRAKYCFFQKHDSGGFPEQVKKVPITEKDGSVEDYLYVDDAAGLLAAIQMNALEFHIWGSTRTDIERPNRIVFDIDPDEGLGFDAVKHAAVDIRDLLGALGLKSYPMVTGGKGVHVVAPLTPEAEWPEVKAFCKAFADRLAANEPDRFVATMSKAKRKGRMFIDYLRNERGSTAIAPYSTRSREGAPVAMPVTWNELQSLDRANGFMLAEAAHRAIGPDPWRGYARQKQSITAAMIAALTRVKV